MKRFKAFTLIELIVVMAIFGILMAALMNFFKPVRETYIDSTLYDQQRSTQDGILEYLSESTRYANKMAIYDEGSSSLVPGTSGTISSATAALDDFCKLYEITDAAEKKKIKVIVINRKQTYDKVGKRAGSSTGTSTDAFRGRLITNVADTEYTGGDEGARTQLGVETGDTFMALGGAYYGAADYIIGIDKQGTFSGTSYLGGITFTVTNTLDNTGNIVKNGMAISGSSTVTSDSNGVTLTTTQGNLTKNLTELKYSFKSGTSDTPFGTKSSTGVYQGLTNNTYIVFTVPDENDR